MTTTAPALGTAWRRAAATPALTAYVALLATTSLVLALLGAGRAQAVLESQSTNLVNLAHAPLEVLVSSAFWLGSPAELAVVAAAVPLLAYAERRLGTRRWLQVFAAGHVGATLVVAAGLVAGIVGGSWSADSVDRVVDVGFSYGGCAVVGAVLPVMSRRLRWATLGVLVPLIVVDGLVGGDLATACGHLTALALGVAVARAL